MFNGVNFELMNPSSITDLSENRKGKRKKKKKKKKKPVKVKKFKRKGVSDVAKKKKKKKKKGKKKGKKKHSNTTAVGTVTKVVPRRAQKLIVDGAIVAGGFVGMNLIDGFLPADIITNDFAKIGVKSAIAVGVSLLVGAIVPKHNRDVAVKLGTGMAVNVIIDAMNTFKITQFLPLPKTTGETATGEAGGVSAIISNNRRSGLGLMMNGSSQYR